jgi:hypothetical protein
MTPRAATCWAALLLGGLLPACPGDDAPAQSTTGESTSTGSTTSGGTPTGTAADTSSSGVDPDAATLPSTGEPTTGDESSSTGGGPGTTGDESSTSDTGVGIDEQGYGDCFNNPAGEVCLPGETCIDDAGNPPGVSVCALQDCAGAGGCPVPPPGGTAAPACMDVTGDSVAECVLACGGGASCPTGMVCFAEFVCVWGGGLGPGDFSCVDQDLGSATGNGVAMGSTIGQGNDFTPGCVMSSAPDVQLVWTPLVAGTYTFDTLGSTFDTVLHARVDCVGPQLACNDDTFMTLSQITLDLVAGQSVMIVIDGWNQAAGNYVLNIH